MSQLTLIVAATTKNGIGRNATLPWHIPRDLAYFSRVTTHAPGAQVNAVLMGRKTWESIPKQFRPLRKRVNIVLSGNGDYDLFPDGTAPSSTAATYLCPNLENAAETLRSQSNVHRLFVIGGTSLYQETLALGSQDSGHPLPQTDRILITRVHEPEFECDAFFPDVLSGEDWRRASHQDLCSWIGFEVPAGTQTENDIQFEFQMWIRSKSDSGQSRDP